MKSDHRPIPAFVLYHGIQMLLPGFVITQEAVSQYLWKLKAPTFDLSLLRYWEICSNLIIGLMVVALFQVHYYLKSTPMKSLPSIVVEACIVVIDVAILITVYTLSLFEIAGIFYIIMVVLLCLSIDSIIGYRKGKKGQGSGDGT